MWDSGGAQLQAGGTCVSELVDILHLFATIDGSIPTSKLYLKRVQFKRFKLEIAIDGLTDDKEDDIEDDKEDDIDLTFVNPCILI